MVQGLALLVGAALGGFCGWHLAKTDTRWKMIKRAIKKAKDEAV